MVASLLLAVTLSIAAPAAAAWRSYWIEDFDATIVVGADGVLEVTEVIRFYFDGSYNGIYRDIPLRYDDNMGFNYRLGLDVLSVTDGDGAPLRYEVSNASGGRRRITAWVPGARDTARTVAIRYRVERALRFFPEHDELYWNVTGNEWGVPIQAAAVRVLLPAGMAEAPRATAFSSSEETSYDAERASVWRPTSTPRVRSMRPTARAASKARRCVSSEATTTISTIQPCCQASESPATA